MSEQNEDISKYLTIENFSDNKLETDVVSKDLAQLGCDYEETEVLNLNTEIACYFLEEVSQLAAIVCAFLAYSQIKLTKGHQDKSDPNIDIFHEKMEQLGKSKDDYEIIRLKVNHLISAAEIMDVDGRRYEFKLDSSGKTVKLEIHDC